MFAIALWLMSVPDPPPQATQRLIGLEGKVSAKGSPLIKINKAIDNKMTKSALFIQNSFLFGLHSVFQFTKKVYFVKLIYRIKKVWSWSSRWLLIYFSHRRCFKGLINLKGKNLNFKNCGLRNSGIKELGNLRIPQSPNSRIHQFTKFFQTYLWEHRTQGRPNCREAFRMEYWEGYSHRDHLFLDCIYNRKPYIAIFPSLFPPSDVTIVRSNFHLIYLPWSFNYFKISSS